VDGAVHILGFGGCFATKNCSRSREGPLMLTISTTSWSPELPPPPPATSADPARLDRWADVLVSQGFEKQGSRLAHRAAEMREARP
jgi:hypothetical protein